MFNIFNMFKKVRVVTSKIMQKGMVMWMGRNSKEYTVEGYNKNVIVYRCVDIKSKALASIPLVVQVNGEDVEDHPLQKLLDKPNPTQSGQDFIRALTAFKAITGTSYAEALGPDNQPPIELWVWPPYNMKVIASEDPRVNMPFGYVYDSGQYKVAWEIDVLTGKSDLLQWKTFNPLNRHYGQSPIEAAAFEVDQHNAASEWNMNMLQNSATPDGVLSTEKILSDDQFKQLQKHMDEQHTGPRNAKKSMILEGDLTWSQMSLSPKDMDWLEGKRMAATEIAAAFGTPTQIIPIPGDQTFANFEQARQSFWEDTVIPEGEDLIAELNTWLAPMFGDNVSIRMDLDAVPALAGRRAEKWTTIKDANFLTINEKRKELNYDIIGKAEDPNNPHNQIWFPANLFPITDVDDDVNEDDEGIPEPTEDDLFADIDKEMSKLMHMDLGTK